MVEKSLHFTRLIRLTMGRNSLRLFLLLSDFSSAIFIAWLVRKYLPFIPDSNYILQVWLGAFAVIWLLTYDMDRNFRLDLYLTYARLLKIAFYTAVGYLLFFVLTRSFYSLRFLLVVTLLWITLAIVSRWLLNILSPPMRGLALEMPPSSLVNNYKINWKIVDDPKSVTLNDYDVLLIDFFKRYTAECQQLFTHAHVVGLPILSVPQLVEHLTGKISIEHFSDHWVEATFYINPFYLRFKRIADIVIALFFLPLIILLSLVVALLVFVFMGKPILFWQKRNGLDDKPFNIVKFRTMVKDADKLGANSTAKGDHRVTALGAILRKLRLDELPQFYNVLKGDMSLIGPRPESTILAEGFMKNIPLFQVRHWLRPGITGWAQVMHGYASSQDEMMEKIRYDMFYLKNMSLWLDLIILFRTIVIVITGFGSR